MNFTVEFETTVEINGDEVEVQVNGDAEIYTDSNYGADADGRRGISQDFMDDFGITVTSASGQDVTKDLETNHPKEFAKLESEAEEKLWSEFGDFDPSDDGDAAYDAWKDEQSEKEQA